MIERSLLEYQIAELTRLVESAGDDPILKPQLASRLRVAHERLEQSYHAQGVLGWPTPPLPRSAIFLRGGGVHGSQGIRPSLAGNALIQYEKMFVAQATHDERIAAIQAGRQRRPRGAAMPGLIFTGTPRGSFGLEFSPQPTNDAALIQVHEKSLKNISAAIARIATQSPENVEAAISQIPRRYCNH